LSEVDDPVALCIVPYLVVHLGTEHALETIMSGDHLGIVPDLRAVRVLVLGDVACLLQQRQVAVPFNITHQPRVAVPVPCSAVATSNIDKDDIFGAEAGFNQAGCKENAIMAGARNCSLVLE
jgi:hypothetical protein